MRIEQFQQCAGGRDGILRFISQTARRLWLINFAGDWDCSDEVGLEAKPVVKCVVEGHSPIDGFAVLLCRVILLTDLLGGMKLAEMSERSGVTRKIGHLDIDPLLTALNPAKHDIHAERRNGEVRKVFVGGDAANGNIEVVMADAGRVSGISIVDESHMVIFRQRCYLQKMDIRTALPP